MELIIEQNTGGYTAESVLAALEAGATLVPTDKNYKIYLKVEGHREGKAYFDNWTEEQKNKLITMCNEGKVKFDAPGYFYVLPFFMKKVD